MNTAQTFLRCSSIAILLSLHLILSSCRRTGTPSSHVEDARSGSSYGYELIANTSKYLGPKGLVSQSTNGMNCQHCHRSAGTDMFAIPLTAAYSAYPRIQKRSGMAISLKRRIADCFERSLNGKAPSDDSPEMSAIVEYLRLIGDSATRTSASSASPEIEFLDRAADPARGRKIFMKQCTACHGSDGAGKLAEDGVGYTDPPLWGGNSYNTGAGLHRLSRLATFVLYNMPFGSTHDAPLLTLAQAWDMSAYIASQSRPSLKMQTRSSSIERRTTTQHLVSDAIVV
jgi:thiosulfate dehydrogenase